MEAARSIGMSDRPHVNADKFGIPDQGLCLPASLSGPHPGRILSR